MDRAVFARVAGVRPLLDPILPGLSRACDHGLLWWGTAVALSVSSGRRRRAALRGMAALGLASAVANGPAKLLFRRGRPDPDGVPLPRRLRRDLTTFSFPSGHSASAAAFATAVAMDAPGVAIPIGVLAGAVAFSRVYVGVHYPSDVIAGVAIGVSAALATVRVMPQVSVLPSTEPPGAGITMFRRGYEPAVPRTAST
jgi:undecaprenyl-diphosphatase